MSELQNRAFLDQNGAAVHRFALDMANLGFAVFTEKLLAMLDSEVWQEFQDGLGAYHFLQGEYDYFLSQQGVTREYVMHGVADVRAKARLEEAMDERRTGTPDYRRRLTDVRTANPTRPGRPIVPFGFSLQEAKVLHEEGSVRVAKGRPPLGQSVRVFRNTGGLTTVSPSRRRPVVERLTRSAVRLPDEEFATLLNALAGEQQRRLSLG